MIIVYGDMISGMTGRFVNIKYKDAFNNKNKEFKQLCLWKESNILNEGCVTIWEVEEHSKM